MGFEKALTAGGSSRRKTGTADASLPGMDGRDVNAGCDPEAEPGLRDKTEERAITREGSRPFAFYVLFCWLPGMRKRNNCGVAYNFSVSNAICSVLAQG